MEANVKETRAEWPADGMASLIFPNGLRKIYGTLKDPKGQDAVMSWLGRYILTGEDRAGYKVEEYLKILLKDEVARIFRKCKANAANASKGGRPPKATQNPSETQAKPDGNPTATQAKADEHPTETQPKPDRNQNKREREREIYINPTPTSDARDAGAGAREAGAGSEVGVGVEPVGSESEEDLGERLKWAQDTGGVLRGLSGNPVGLANILAVTPDVRLPEFAIALCREGNRERALKGYDEAMAEMGEGRFRLLLEQFVGDIKEGREPKRRGAAFMARVMSGLKALRARKEG